MRVGRVPYRLFIEVALLLLLGALFYLPYSQHFGYYGADWYSMYAAQVKGPDIFHSLYSVEGQPARAFLMVPLYGLFGGNPFLYAISAYFLRMIGAITFLWLLRMIWPERARETLWGAILFLAYPGYLSQPHAIAVQPHLFAAWMAVLSLGLTLRSILESHSIRRSLLALGAVSTGWLYLGQAGFYIGYEVIRFALILFLFARSGWTRQKLWDAARAWAFFLVIPAIYLIGLFLTSSALLPSSDMVLQPIGFIPRIASLLQAIVERLLLSWIVPFVGPGFGLRLRDALTAGALSMLVLALFFFSLRLDYVEEHGREQVSLGFASEALGLGALWVICGLLPAALVSSADILARPGYDLLCAAGAAIFMLGLIVSLSSRPIQAGALGLVFLSASVAHYANNVSLASQSEELSSFWWQVSWRVPQFEPGATLVIHYATLQSSDAYSVWGPANLIYYSKYAPLAPLESPLAAVIPDHNMVVNILSHSGAYEDLYPVVNIRPDPANIVVASQPSGNSCVHLIDASHIEYSTTEDLTLRLLGPYSDAGNILAQSAPEQPPRYPFGPEPPRSWCYYYEKASLARQQGDWDEVLRLEGAVTRQNLRPDDQIEWMPFLQAYAINGNNDKLAGLSRAIWSDEYAARQACAILNAMSGLSEQTRQVIDRKYCSRP